MYFDTHAHTNDERLVGSQEEIISELKGKMYGFFEVGFNVASSIKALELSKKYQEVYAIIGTHPEDAPISDEDIEIYRSMCQDDKVIAIGEIGLDYHYRTDNKQEQANAFIKQLGLAKEVGLPTVIHLRDAYGDFEDLLSQNKHLLGTGMLLHCYSGSAEYVKQMKKYDAYFALGGIVTFKNAKKDDVIKAIPLDRLVVETDCPYCTPEPFRGKTNRPVFTQYVLDKISKVLEINTQELEDIILENTLRLFRKVKIKE